MAKQATPGSKRLENAKHELFAYLYSGHHNRQLFGNGTRSYMEAYGLNQEVLKLEKEIDELLAKKPKGYTVAIELRERRIKSRERLASVEGSGLLAKPSIRVRIDFLLDKLNENAFMDRELVFTAGQRHDLNAKVAAIREYNRVKDRTSDKLEGDFTFRWEK